jgi:hypothetical protein
LTHRADRILTRGLRDWAKSLNTTPERVKEAVQVVGDRADKVREYLGDRERKG